MPRIKHKHVMYYVRIRDEQTRRVVREVFRTRSLKRAVAYKRMNQGASIEEASE